MIICHSNNPFPVWIWSSDNITEKEMDKAYQIVSAHFPFDEGYTFNIKYELAKYFIQRAMSDNINLSIKRFLFSRTLKSIKSSVIYRHIFLKNI